MAREAGGVKTARSGIVYVVGQSMGSVAILLTFAVLARLFTTTDWGLYSIIIAFYTFFGMLGNFSIGSAVRKKMAEQKGIGSKRALIGNAYLASLFISLVIALVGILISGYAANYIYHQPQIAGPLVLAACLIVFWALFNLTLSVLVSLEKAAKAALINIIYSVVQLGIASILVFLGYGIMGAIWGLAAGIVTGTIVGLAFLWKAIGRPVFRLDAERMRGILKFAAPVYVSFLVMQGVYSFGILLLGGVVSATVVGNYNIGYELGGFVNIILSTSVFILLPAFSAASLKSRSKSRIGESLNKSIYYTLLFLAPLVAYVVSVSSPLTFLLFSHKYLLAPLYLSVVAVGLAVGIIWNYASTMMLGMGDMRKFIKYQVASAAVEFALLFALTPVLKIWGLLLGLFVIFPIVMDIAYLREFMRSTDFRPRFGKAGLAVAAAVLTFAVLYLSARLLGNGYIAIAVNVVLGFLVYPPVIAFIGGVGKQDIKFLYKAVGTTVLAKPVSLCLGYTELFAR